MRSMVASRMQRYMGGRWALGFLTALALSGWGVAVPAAGQISGQSVSSVPGVAADAGAIGGSGTPAGEAGTVATGLLLRQLAGVKRVLMIGAHPDDEDTGFLAALARGRGAETAYLSLTRGDGGQNLIGPELFEGLGVIRTGELEAARALDGGRQLFTRAFDFGFSKTAEETLAMWPRNEVLRDVVWAVRSFRPQVMVSVFRGTPADGHGHHQAAGVLAREAFALAGDSSAFPDQFDHGVGPWAPDKLLVTSRRRFLPDAPPVDDEIVVPTGDFDALLGRSTFQLAMDSRSQHRSQDMGASQPPGPRNTGTVVVETRVSDSAEGIFSGVDTTWVGRLGGLPPETGRRVAGHVGAYRTVVGRAQAAFTGEFSGRSGPAVMPELVRAVRALDGALAALDEAVTGSPPGREARELRRDLWDRRGLAARTLTAASGVIFDVRAEDDLVVPGQSVTVEAILWNGGSARLRDVEVSLAGEAVRRGWEVRALGRDGVTADGAVSPGSLATWTYEVRVPPDAEPSRLYYLREDRDGAMYRWPDAPELWGLPRDPARLVGGVTMTLGGERGVTAVLRAPWRYVGVDQAYGEFTEPVLVVPRVSVQVSPAGSVWPEGSREPRTVGVTVRSEDDAGVSGEVRLEAPGGWVVSPERHRFEVAGSGSERTVSFRVNPVSEVEAGSHVLRGVVHTDAGERFTEGYTLIDYDHIERAALFRSAEVEIEVVPVRVREGLRVGYIMGTGDGGAEAIEQMGGNVQLLSEAEVRSGDFSSYDVLVLGVRAYEARADVRAVNDQILDFARAGGVVVNQYNQYQFSGGGYAPYPLTMDRPAPRVSVETQPVTFIEPEAPVFHRPNRITQDDFSGWVQERGLYFASTWDDAFVPLLEMNDPGEPPRHGSLLVAEVGEGLYAYVALSFFRQWSQRVPGAYRLFANLISLNPEEWRAFRGR